MRRTSWLFPLSQSGAASLSQAAPPKPQADDGCGDLKTYGTLSRIPLPYVEYNLSYFMDRAFEGKLAKSILGLQPDPSSVGDPLNNIKPLVPLAVEESRFGSNGPAFLFTERTAPVVVTDKKTCFPESLKNSVRRKVCGGPYGVCFETGR